MVCTFFGTGTRKSFKQQIKTKYQINIQNMCQKNNKNKQRTRTKHDKTGGWKVESTGK